MGFKKQEPSRAPQNHGEKKVNKLVVLKMLKLMIVFKMLKMLKIMTMLQHVIPDNLQHLPYPTKVNEICDHVGPA